MLFTLSPEVTDIVPGHLLERMLTKDQADVQVLSHPFSASRGKQVPWLLRDDYAEGMKEDESREYEQQIQKEVGIWEKALNDAQAVSFVFTSFRFTPSDANHHKQRLTKHQRTTEQTPPLHPLPPFLPRFPLRHPLPPQRRFLRLLLPIQPP